MNNSSDLEYKKTYLDNVILRVDFLQFLETDALFSADIEGVILKHFPRRGMDQKMYFGTINVRIDPNKIGPQGTHNSKTQEGIQREYSFGSNKIMLSNKYIIYAIDEYRHFEYHYDVFQRIIFSLYSKQKINTARIGIRYINLFDVNDIRLRKNMFSPEISATLHNKKKDSENSLSLIRAMCLKEYQEENLRLNFRYGMFNPDYPNPLVKESFALDYDCFTTEPFDSTDEVLMVIKNGHTYIKQFFENSITESLRKVLRNG